jgi:hypothetical protein
MKRVKSEAMLKQKAKANPLLGLGLEDALQTITDYLRSDLGCARGKTDRQTDHDRLPAQQPRVRAAGMGSLGRAGGLLGRGWRPASHWWCIGGAATGVGDSGWLAALGREACWRNHRSSVSVCLGTLRWPRAPAPDCAPGPGADRRETDRHLGWATPGADSASGLCASRVPWDKRSAAISAVNALRPPAGGPIASGLVPKRKRSSRH